MSMKLPYFFECNYCNKQSLKVTPSSISSEYDNRRTDGSYVNGIEKNVLICPHCKKIIIVSELKFIEEDLWNYNIDWKSSNNKWFIHIFGTLEIIKALGSKELENHPEILYNLKLQFWRETNNDLYYYNSHTIEKGKENIYNQLLEEWKDKVDERYLFSAELLRNTKRYEESNELLKNYDKKYESVIIENPEWVEVITKMNSLHLPQSVKILIGRYAGEWTHT